MRISWRKSPAVIATPLVSVERLFFIAADIGIKRARFNNRTIPSDEDHIRALVANHKLKTADEKFNMAPEAAM